MEIESVIDLKNDQIYKGIKKRLGIHESPKKENEHFDG